MNIVFKKSLLGTKICFGDRILAIGNPNKYLKLDGDKILIPAHLTFIKDWQTEQYVLATTEYEQMINNINNFDIPRNQSAVIQGVYATNMLELSPIRSDHAFDLKMKDKEIEAKLTNIIFSAIDKVKQNEKYDMIFSKGVASISARMDITDKVLEEVKSKAK